MNQQNPLPRTTSTTLSLHSVFKTIQGEGPFSGVVCVFVRLAGCNLQCPGCDTEYTRGSEDVTASKVISKVVARNFGKVPKLVVITGGEPFRQNIIPLIEQLQDIGCHVQVETNGTMKPCLLDTADNNVLDQATIVCSPKTEKLNPNLIPFIDCFKYVMRYDDKHEMDGLPNWALDNRIKTHVARPPENFEGDIYLQPMDMTEHYKGMILIHKEDIEAHNELNLQACVNSCYDHNYILQLQLHKLIGVE